MVIKQYQDQSMRGDKSLRKKSHEIQIVRSGVLPEGEVIYLRG
jgi:hypothetical protein